MSEWIPPEVTGVFDQFDSDYGNNQLDTTNQMEVLPVDMSSSSASLNNDVFGYQDPLKYGHKYQFQPLDLDLGNTHSVTPHYVDGYLRNDGTYVEGYYRDGDGNPNTNLSKEQGGGYLRSNPDGNPFNNLG